MLRLIPTVRAMSARSAPFARSRNRFGKNTPQTHDIATAKFLEDDLKLHRTPAPRQVLKGAPVVAMAMGAEDLTRRTGRGTRPRLEHGDQAGIRVSHGLKNQR